MDNEFRDLIIRLDERVKALTEKFDAYVESSKANYLCKEQFNKWESEEFSPIREKVNEFSRFQWLAVGSIVASLVTIFSKFIFHI